MEDLEEREKRKNGTSVFNEPYSIEAIERLKSMIKTFEAQGKRKHYTILVDNETVVEKNASFHKFDDYRPFVNPHTKTIEVRMYLGMSPNCNRHVFHKSEATLKGVLNASLPTVDVQAEIAKALAEQKRVFDLSETQKKLKKKNKQIKKLKLKLGESSTGLEGIQDLATKAVQIAGMFKGGQTQLMGVQNQQTPTESEVSIEPEEMTEEEEIYNDLIDEVGIKGLKKTLRVMELLSKHPELEEILNNELKKGKNDK